MSDEVKKGDRVQYIHDRSREFEVIFVQKVDGKTEWTLHNGMIVREWFMHNWVKMK